VYIPLDVEAGFLIHYLKNREKKLSSSTFSSSNTTVEGISFLMILSNLQMQQISEINSIAHFSVQNVKLQKLNLDYKEKLTLDYHQANCKQHALLATNEPLINA
jgi:hypothetical protein